MANAVTRRVGQITDRGHVRDVNEDRVYACEPTVADKRRRRGSLYAIADGMGGMSAGAAAAEAAIRTLAEEYYGSDPELSVEASLTRAIQEANKAVRALSQREASGAKAGTTIVCAVLRDNHVVVANVGDSRAYVMREGAARCLTRDHSWVAEQVLAGKMTEAQARIDARRHLVTRSLGIRSDVEADLFEESLAPDDVIVLCSDGIHGLLADHEIEAIVTRSSPQTASEGLVRRANERGGADNSSAIVVGPARRASAGDTSQPTRVPLALAAVVAVVALAGAVAAALSIDAPAYLPPSAPAVLAAVPPSHPAPAIATIRAPALTPIRLVLTQTVVILTAGPTAAGTKGLAGEAVLSFAPTETLVPVPPDHSIAVPTVTAGHSASASRILQTTPSATPEPPTPTATAVPTQAAPRILALNPVAYPPGSVVISWTLSGGLGPDETFDVRAWRSDGIAQTSVANSSDSTYAIGGSFPAGDYSWTVAVIHLPDKSTVLDAAQMSSFHWSPPLAGNGGGGSDIGHRQR